MRTEYENKLKKSAHALMVNFNHKLSHLESLNLKNLDRVRQACRAELTNSVVQVAAEHKVPNTGGASNVFQRHFQMRAVELEKGFEMERIRLDEAAQATKKDFQRKDDAILKLRLLVTKYHTQLKKFTEVEVRLFVERLLREQSNPFAHIEDTQVDSTAAIEKARQDIKHRDDTIAELREQLVEYERKDEVRARKEQMQADALKRSGSPMKTLDAASAAAFASLQAAAHASGLRITTVAEAERQRTEAVKRTETACEERIKKLEEKQLLQLKELKHSGRKIIQGYEQKFSAIMRGYQKYSQMR